jgi:hypothetical protein
VVTLDCISFVVRIERERVELSLKANFMARNAAIQSSGLGVEARRIPVNNIITTPYL